MGLIVTLINVCVGALFNKHFRPQEVGGTLIGENGLEVTTGAESVEWYPIH